MLNMKVKIWEVLNSWMLKLYQKTAPKGVASDKAGMRTTGDKCLNPNRSERSRWFLPDTTTITTKRKRKEIFVNSCDLVVASEDTIVPVTNCSVAMQIVPPMNSHIQSCSLIEKGQISKHTSLSSKGRPEQQEGQVPSLYSVQSPSRRQQTLFSSIIHLSPHEKIITHLSQNDVELTNCEYGWRVRAGKIHKNQR